MAGFRALCDRVRNLKIYILKYDVFLQICTVMLSVIHITLGITLWIAQERFLSRLNILSVLCYVTAFFYARRNRIKLVYHIIITEVLIYSFLSVYLLGDDTLFAHYCLAIMPFTFLTSYILKCQNEKGAHFHPTIHFIVISLFYLLEQAMPLFHTPLFQIEHSGVRYFLQGMNLSINVLCNLLGCGVLSAVAIDNTAVIRRNMEEMERLMHAAEASNEAKSAFLANMSHEIRTPMNAICGMTDMLLDEELSDQGKEYAATIKSSGEGLLSIINDILDFSKIESGKMAIISEEYYFTSMIHDVMSMMEVRVKDKPVRLLAQIQDSVPSKLYGDIGRVKQILINIMGNATKFTHEGTITLKVVWQPETEEMGRLVFSIIDTGIGIKPENISRLFDAFEQVDTRKNKGIEGTGLGLSISKLLVERMGGRIQVESEYGKGSCFTFDILQKVIDGTPCEYSKKGRKVSPAKPFAVAFTVPDARVLVVDDNKVNLRVASRLLKKFGIAPDLVDNGRDCVEMIRKNIRYDLIFMDHMMPEMDGIEAARLIRAIGAEYTDQLPIVALSANAVQGMEEEFLENGMNDFLPKPIELARLADILQRWLPPEKIRHLEGETAAGRSGNESADAKSAKA
ncbi:MAG: ATP-binding protein [Clostridiales bacterium]|nr:ATP-binding protein [Clostridiales bacterium]